MLTTIYLVGLIGFTAWAVYCCYTDSRPVGWEWFDLGLALLIWPLSALFALFMIGFTAWDRRGY